MTNERPSLRDIEVRHGRDRWKDGGFIAVALLSTIISLAALSSRLAGKPSKHEGQVSVVYSNLEIQR